METEFPAFQEEIGEIEREMAGKSGTSRSQYDCTQEDEINLVPDFLRNTFSGLGTFKQIALGIGLSPFLVTGFILRLPYLGFKVLGKIWTQKKMEYNFKAAAGNATERKTICENYAKKIVKTIIDSLNLTYIIEEDMSVLFKFLETQRQRMLVQIKEDEDLLSKLKLVESSDRKMVDTCKSLKTECKTLDHHFRHFMLMYIPSHFLKLVKMNVTITETTVCSGLIAEILVAETEVDGVKKQVCLRREKYGMGYSETRHFTGTLQKCRYHITFRFQSKTNAPWGSKRDY